MRKNSVKLTRINQEIVKELSAILRSELKDPRVDMMTSVTAADTATDLKTCKVYISVYGDEEKMQSTLEALKNAEGFIKRMLAKNLNLRNTPALTFLPDRSITYGMHIDGILRDLSVPAGEETNDEEP